MACVLHLPHRPTIFSLSILLFFLWNKPSLLCLLRLTSGDSHLFFSTLREHQRTFFSSGFCHFLLSLSDLSPVSVSVPCYSASLRPPALPGCLFKHLHLALSTSLPPSFSSAPPHISSHHQSYLFMPRLRLTQHRLCPQKFMCHCHHPFSSLSSAGDLWKKQTWAFFHEYRTYVPKMNRDIFPVRTRLFTHQCRG